MRKIRLLLSASLSNYDNKNPNTGTTTSDRLGLFFVLLRFLVFLLCFVFNSANHIQKLAEELLWLAHASYVPRELS